MKPRQARRWRGSLGMAAVLFLLVALLSAAPVVREVQLRLVDSYFRIQPPGRAKSPVVLVLIDDQSLREYGRWPWSRALLAELTRKLAGAGAGAIGLDILVSEPQSAEADTALRAALRDSGRAVLVDKIGQFADGPHWVEPQPEFAAAAVAVGHAQAVLDSDGVCRHFPPRILSPDGPRWAFAIEVARRLAPQAAAAFLRAYGISAEDDVGPVSIARPVLVPIAFRRGGFDVISAASVLRGDAPADLSGRPVLVGFGPTEISDRVSTPLTGGLPAPGVAVHAEILNSILSGRRLHSIPLGATALLLMLTCWLLVGCFRRWRGWRTGALLVALAAGVYGLGWLMFSAAALLLPVGPAMLAVVLAPALVYTADFVVVERSLTRQLLDLRRWLALRGDSAVATHDLHWRLELLSRLQTELGSTYELHRALLEATQDLVAIFDVSGRLLLANQRFAAAFPSTGEMCLPTFLELAPPPPGMVVTGASAEYETRVGDELYSLRLAPLPATTLAPTGGTIVTLASLRARVERDRARAEALGFVTHELRTPLVAIQGFAELMMEHPDSPASAQGPKTIFRESRRLLAVIHTYLDVLRLEAGARRLRSDFVEIDKTVQEMLELLQPVAAAADMRLGYESEEPLSLIADAPLLAGAVLNLVSNAIKYGEAGTEVTVRAGRRPEGLVLAVHNAGPPIAPGEISRLFAPFCRASATEMEETGWGLGLAFVKRIAESHGGSVQVESRGGRTVFEIVLPLALRAAVAIAAKEKA